MKSTKTYQSKNSSGNNILQIRVTYYFSSGVKLINLKHLDVHSIERLSENRRNGIHSRIQKKLGKQRKMAQEKKAKEEARLKQEKRRQQRRKGRKSQE